MNNFLVCHLVFESDRAAKKNGEREQTSHFLTWESPEKTVAG